MRCTDPRALLVLPVLLTLFCSASQSKRLIQAVTEGRAAEARSLLTRGADPNAEDSTGKPALMLACLNNDDELVRVLLKSGASGNNLFGPSVLRWASLEGHTDIVRMLLEAGASVNRQPRAQMTELCNAAARGHYDIVRILLEAGSWINAALDNGESALSLASAAGHTDIVSFLLDRKAEVNSVARQGASALMRAAVGGHYETVCTLLAAGANIDFKTQDGWNAAMLAEAAGHAELSKALDSADSASSSCNDHVASPFGSGALRPEATVSAPVLEYQVRPEYSAAALARKCEGTVVIEAVVLKNGLTGPLRVVKSLDLDLDLNAIRAVRRWRFAPGQRNNVPVDVLAEIEIEFTLPGR